MEIEMLQSVTILSKAAGVVSRIIEEEAVILPLPNTNAPFNRVWSVNATGTFIWNAVDGHRSVEDITNAIIKVFDVNPTVAYSDVLKFLDVLVNEGLLYEAG